MNFILRVWTKEYTDRPYVLQSEMNFSISRKFRERGIEIPFPQRDIYIESGSLMVATPAVASAS